MGRLEQKILMVTSFFSAHLACTAMLLLVVFLCRYLALPNCASRDVRVPKAALFSGFCSRSVHCLPHKTRRSHGGAHLLPPWETHLRRRNSQLPDGTRLPGRLEPWEITAARSKVAPAEASAPMPSRWQGGGRQPGVFYRVTGGLLPCTVHRRCGASWAAVFAPEFQAHEHLWYLLAERRLSA